MHYLVTSIRADCVLFNFFHAVCFLHRQFKDSELEELKLTATTYTAHELEALAKAAADLNLAVYPNKDKEVCYHMCTLRFLIGAHKTQFRTL